MITHVQEPIPEVAGSKDRSAPNFQDPPVVIAARGSEDEQGFFDCTCSSSHGAGSGGDCNCGSVDGGGT